MPGFTAPKLLWVRRHEPTVFARVRKVLLPKAYIRYRLTGEMIEEMSDASGTLWLDVGARDWSDAALSATDLARDAMPRLVEGNARAGTLRPELAARWRMAHQPVWRAGQGTMPRVQSASPRSGRATLSSHLVLPACCLPPRTVSVRIRRLRCTRSVTRYLVHGTRWV